MHDIMLLILAYLLGTFPPAFLLTRLLVKKDIRREGSGNVGGMNTIKRAGLLPGLVVIVLDTGKGALAVYLASILGASSLLPLVAAFLVILGHNFNPWLGFKGGKGLAAALGVFLVLSPQSIPWVLAVMILLSLLLRDTNSGFGLGLAAIPLVLWLQGEPWPLPVAGTAMAALMLLKHLPDFKAYRRGRRQLF